MIIQYNEHSLFPEMIDRLCREISSLSYRGLQQVQDAISSRTDQPPSLKADARKLAQHIAKIEEINKMEI